MTKQILFRRLSCPISVRVLARLVGVSSAMTKDDHVARGTVMSGPLISAFLSSTLLPVWD